MYSSQFQSLNRWMGFWLFCVSEGNNGPIFWNGLPSIFWLSWANNHKFKAQKNQNSKDFANAIIHCISLIDGSCCFYVVDALLVVDVDVFNRDFEAFTPKLKECRNFGVTFLHWIFCNGRSITTEDVLPYIREAISDRKVLLLTWT